MSDPMLHLRALKTLLEKFPFKKGELSRNSNFAFNFISQLGRKFPEAVDGSIVVDKSLPPILEEYLDLPERANIQIMGVDALVDEAGRSYQEQGDIQVKLQIPTGDTFPRGMILSIREGGPIISFPFGLKKDAADVRDFLTDFGQRPHDLARIAADVAFEGATIAVARRMISQAIE